MANALRSLWRRIAVASWADPRRGDVVTCWSPRDGARLVKRVVGVPGDTVAMRGGRLIVNGEQVACTPLPAEEARRAMGPAAEAVEFWREDLPDLWRLWRVIDLLLAERMDDA